MSIRITVDYYSLFRYTIFEAIPMGGGLETRLTSIGYATENGNGNDYCHLLESKLVETTRIVL